MAFSSSLSQAAPKWRVTPGEKPVLKERLREGVVGEASSSSCCPLAGLDFDCDDEGFCLGGGSGPYNTRRTDHDVGRGCGPHVDLGTDRDVGRGVTVEEVALQIDSMLS
ncbi:hypothetical protein ACLOJK_000980 [Asimina triloba]